ncbi:hypothetical protein FRC11_004750 [Ceratobasidium sp. 423]|nr:hypothetical protein FRC11_004750 [Ceratobasidium sp. 423]
MASTSALSTQPNLHEIFKYRIPNAGKIVAAALSPDGYRLCYATDQGVLILVDTRIGHFQVCLNAVSATEITVLGWTSDTQAILGTGSGDLYAMSLRHSTMNYLPVVDISYLFQDNSSSIISLACNASLR